MTFFNAHPFSDQPPACRVLIADSSNRYDGSTQDFVSGSEATTAITSRPGLLQAQSLRDFGWLSFMLSGTYTQVASATTLGVRLAIDGTLVGFQTSVVTPATSTTGLGMFIMVCTLAPIGDEGGTYRQLMHAQFTFTDNAGTQIGSDLVATSLYTIDTSSDHTIAIAMKKNAVVGSIIDMRSITCVQFAPGGF